jgi:16S rRNA (cytidine1402-2'-O)-methyltransferase
MSSAQGGGTDPAAPRRAGLLSVIGTPIGHLDDITVRALATLRAADVVLAEDTRRTRKLLTHHAIGVALRSLHAHSAPRDVERCLEELEQGRHLALVTDAGTPLISDPGAALVVAARERGLTIESIPGPSAVIAALSVCGVPFDGFRFVGFAPRTGAKRRLWLQEVASDAGAHVFFESPARLVETLRELADQLAQGRLLAVCRELTKLHEEVVRGSAAELAEHFAAGVRGEVTVVVSAGETRQPAPAADPDRELAARIAALLAEGVSPRDVARQLARELGLPRRQLYARVQTLTQR